METKIKLGEYMWIKFSTEVSMGCIAASNLGIFSEFLSSFPFEALQEDGNPESLGCSKSRIFRERAPKSLNVK